MVTLLTLGAACSPGQAAHRPDQPAAAATPEADEPSPRRAIAAGLKVSEPGLAAVAERPDARFVALDAPLFDRFRFFRVESLAPPHPVAFHVAVATADAEVLHLNAAPERFAAVVGRDGVSVKTAADALALVGLWIETTRRTSKRYQAISTVEALTLLPPPADAAEAAARKAKLEQARQGIAPPSAQPAGDGAWRVTVSVLDGQTLQKLAVTVSKAGVLTTQSTPVVTDLPLPYVH